jgi:hypothetical protein
MNVQLKISTCCRRRRISACSTGRCPRGDYFVPFAAEWPCEDRTFAILNARRFRASSLAVTGPVIFLVNLRRVADAVSVLRQNS